MKLTDSSLVKEFYETYTLDIGSLYFFNNFVVAQLNEGVSLGLDNLQEAMHLIHQHYGENNFGIIANRINSYAIKVTDAPMINEIFNNLKAYAIVTYTGFAEKIFEIENQFFEFNRKQFKQLDNAKNWVEKEI